MSTPIPRFRLWPVLLWGQLLYLVMAAFFGLFFLASDMLEHQARTLSPPPGEGSLVWFPWLGLVVACGAVLLWHRPLAVVFRALRAHQTPSAPALRLARQRVFRSPLVVGVGVPVAVGGVEVVLALLGMHAELRVLPINLLFLVLTGFFTFLWQRHRIQTRYLAPLFSEAELAERLPPTRDHSIGHTLWVLAILSAVLPVTVVLTLVVTGVTRVSDTAALSADQWTLLLGSTALGHHLPAMIDPERLGNWPVLLINTFDTWRVLVGSFLGVGFMLGYVFFVFRWVSRDLTSPLYALRDAMERVEQGHNEPPHAVVTSNEVGQLTLGFNRMVKGLGERDRIKGLFGQYLTREVSEAILEGRVNLEGDRYEVTVLFTDIRDFTALSDQLPPEEVFGFLNEYLDAMIEVLVARGGFIDKFLGDGILTVFGLPVRSQDHARDAFEAARDMQARLAGLNAVRTAAGKPAIAIGSGLHSGPVIAGNVGSSRKLQFTVIGDTVNLASRLESLNKRWGSAVTLSEATWRRLPEELRSSLPFQKEDGVEIRGKKDRLTLYRLD